MVCLTGDAPSIQHWIEHAVDQYRQDHEPPYDQDAVLAWVLAEPDLSALLDELWDDASTAMAYDALLAHVRREVAHCLDDGHERHDAGAAPR